MKIIDLSTPIYDKMPVFPGDPDVLVTDIDQDIEGNPWYMHQLQLCTHDATHLNVPRHIKEDGKTLDDYDLSAFCGDAVLFESEADMQAGVGVIFDAEHEFTMELGKVAVEKQVTFVGLATEFDLDVERYTLDKGLISYERLVNTDQLPKNFQFFGMPLPIKASNGSPVRAFAVVPS